MSSKRSASIYILTGLLIAVGILIFAFREKLLSYLSFKVFGNIAASQEVALTASPSSLIDVKILENPSFQALKDRVLYFDFDKVGKPVLNQDANANLQAPVWQAVYLGNANPFPVKKKADGKNNDEKNKDKDN